MSLMTLATAATEPADDNYQAGYLDGELDAISKLPAELHTVRAGWGDLYDPMWAAGYADGFIHEVTLNALNRQEANR